jgi:16S rRNA G966 N2-methylase RsmD
LNLEVKYLPINALQPHPLNARIHSKHQIRAIGKSIRSYGFTSPILVDRKNRIIAGHGRVEGAKEAGLEFVPTICLEDLTDEQIRAYRIADNKLAETPWDLDILSAELLALENTNIDLTDTGFEMGEIDAILEGAKAKPAEEEIPPAPDSNQKPVSRPSDLWVLGKHRLICGNSLDQAIYRELFGNRRAALVFLDPPFNCRINGHATGNGSIHHREFMMASGEKSDAEFRSFLKDSLSLAAQYSADRSVHFVCMDWRGVGNLISAGEQVYDHLSNVCVWVKNQGGMGSLYRSQHEFVFVFRKGKGSHRNNIRLGKFGRDRTNVWQYPGIQTLSRQSDEGNLLALHPTVKPIAMVADALLDCSARGDIVLDAFLGSGTTLMAAERVGRVCYGIEIDPLYVDTAVRRWQKYTGNNAIHGVTGRTFNEIQEEIGNV